MNEQKGFVTRIGEMMDRYRADRERAQAQDTRPQPGHLRRFLRWLTPNGGTLLLVAVLILTQRVWARPLLGPAGAPGPSATTVNYQGRLANSSGDPLDGTYGMSFSLWDASTGGSLVWGPESHSAVPVSDGLFSVGLGSQTSGGIPTSTWNGDRYLEITVRGETLSPRELLRSVPIAGMALTVPDGAIGTDQIADGAVTPEKTSDLLESANGDGQIIRYGTATVNTDEHGEAIVPFNYTFPNRVTSFVAMNGSIYGNGGQVIGSLNIDQYVIRSSVKIRTSTPNSTMKINWIAVGY
jgi:hypothetical protein